MQAPQPQMSSRVHESRCLQKRRGQIDASTTYLWEDAPLCPMSAVAGMVLLLDELATSGLGVRTPWNIQRLEM